MAAGPPVSDLSGWARGPFTGAGLTYDCYEKGSGPGVVLIPELPGITPEVLGLAEHLVASGFTVVIPSPFGVPGKKESRPYVMSTFLKLCVSAEFRAFATNAHRPITDYIRAVAANLASRTPAPGVGVIGMCFTGGFALAAAVSDDVLAAVMSQPSVPLPLGRARQLDPGLSAKEMDRVVERANAGEVCGLGLRFTEDPANSRARFDGIKRRLGDAFEYIQLDSSDGNAGGFQSSAHSVLTGEVREDPPNPAFWARERVVEFLHKQLAVPTP